MSFEVDNCCGCFKLRAGSLIIGYFYLIYQVHEIIISCYGIDFGTTAYIESNDDEDVQILAIIILVTFSVYLIVELFNVLFTILLLAGVHKNKRGLVKSYLVYNAIFLILSVINVIINIACDSITTISLAIEICEIVLGTYYYIVIRSHYRLMEVNDLKIPVIYNDY